MHPTMIAFGAWLNTIVPGSEIAFSAARFFLLLTVSMTLWTGVRLCVRYPTVLAFWLASAPLPLVLAYYAGQLYFANYDPPTATHGQLWANLSAGLAFAGYWTLLGMLRKLYREKYGSGFSLWRYLLGSSEPPNA